MWHWNVFPPKNAIFCLIQFRLLPVSAICYVFIARWNTNELTIGDNELAKQRHKTATSQSEELTEHLYEGTEEKHEHIHSGQPVSPTHLNEEPATHGAAISQSV